MLSIRPATVNDAGLLLSLIRELADYEHELSSVTITESQLTQHGFGANPKFRALIAEWDGQAAGYALFFPFFSTWTGPQMFLEDVFVRPQLRGKGIGTALMAQVARVAREENCFAMRWEVLGWNEPSIKTYLGMGAEFLEDWKLMWLTGGSLHNLAQQAA